MTSYIRLIAHAEDFFTRHYQVERFNAEFLEQIDNFTGINEKYPIVYMVLESSTIFEYLAEFTVSLYCLDIIQKDRANINTIVSDCDLILKDYYRYIKDGDDSTIEVLQVPAFEYLNNAFCDYLAGAKMTINIEVETQSLCELPIYEENFIIDGEGNDIITNGNLLIYK